MLQICRICISLCNGIAYMCTPHFADLRTAVNRMSDSWVRLSVLSPPSFSGAPGGGVSLDRPDRRRGRALTGGPPGRRAWPGCHGQGRGPDSP